MNAITTEIRSDVMAAARRELRSVWIKIILFWCVAPTVFYFATRENKIVGPTSNLPMFLAIVFILVLTPLVYFKLWEYAKLMRGFRGTVLKKKIGAERVQRTDRNVGYVTHASDMVPVNMMYLIVNTEDGQEHKQKMLGNHLFSIGQSYYEIGDRVEKFAGARYLYNPNRKISRPLCLYCGYLGTSNETRCSRCRCTLLRGEKVEQE